MFQVGNLGKVDDSSEYEKKPDINAKYIYCTVYYIY